MNDISVQEKFDVNLALAGQLGNGILAQFNTLRETDPIHWSDASGCWMVTRHDDVIKALSGDLPLSLKRLIQVSLHSIPPEERETRYPNVMRYLPNWIIDSDPPIHTRLRKLLVIALNKKVVDAIRPFIRDRVAALMEKLEAQPKIEFSEEIGRLLPGSVILRLLGIPQSYQSKLREWSNAVLEAVGSPHVNAELLQHLEDALIEMNLVFTGIIEERRLQPQNDLITALVNATDNGDQLTLEEMLGAIQLVIVAGHDTTHSSLSLGLAVLAEHPEFWDYMYANPDKTLDCVLELMRYMAMSASQPRIVAEDFEWHGKHLKKGQVVFLIFAAGNRDPRAFKNPEKLDQSRNNDQSLVFAPGMHHCVGHILAKSQLTEFFGELVKRFEGAELLDERLNFMPGIGFRGLYHLNVKMRPRGQATG